MYKCLIDSNKPRCGNEIYFLGVTGFCILNLSINEGALGTIFFFDPGNGLRNDSLVPLPATEPMELLDVDKVLKLLVDILDDDFAGMPVALGRGVSPRIE